MPFTGFYIPFASLRSLIIRRFQAFLAALGSCSSQLLRVETLRLSVFQLALLQLQQALLLIQHARQLRGALEIDRSQPSTHLEGFKQWREWPRNK